MKNLVFSLVLFSLALAMPWANATDQGPEEAWLRSLCQGKEKVAQLRFYIQDALSGPNATVWEVACSNITSTSPTSFGQVRVIDDLITAGPDPNSMKWAQGLITMADLQVPTIAMNINFYFSAGKYNGSMLCILGRNQTLSPNRELPVVAGTRYPTLTLYDIVANYGVLEYVVYVTYVELEE